jgi:hypothetical protein
VTAIGVVRRSDVEPSAAAGLSTETDGNEDNGDDDGRWSSSSRSDCWKMSSENTCCKLTGDDPLAGVNMPTSISPLSHPMKAAICALPAAKLDGHPHANPGRIYSFS